MSETRTMMEPNVPVTVIIPCYNYGKYLEDCLNSVLNQSLSNWQCIIVDDGSVDNTQVVASSFVQLDKRFQYIYQTNGGLSSARNTGIKNATGKFIQFLDADDVIQPEKLKQQVLILESDEKLNITYADVKYFMNDDISDLHDSRNGVDGKWMPYISGSGNLLKHAFLNQNILELGCILFRHSDIKKLGFFQEDCSGVSDWEFCCRAAFNDFFFKYTDIANGSILMRHHSSMSSNRILMLRAVLIARGHISQYATAPEFSKINSDRIDYTLEILGYQYLKIGEQIGRLFIMKAGLRKKNVNTFLRGIFPNKELYKL